MATAASGDTDTRGLACWMRAYAQRIRISETCGKLRKPLQEDRAALESGLLQTMQESGVKCLETGMFDESGKQVLVRLKEGEKRMPRIGPDDLQKAISTVHVTKPRDKEVLDKLLKTMEVRGTMSDRLSVFSFVSTRSQPIGPDSPAVSFSFLEPRQEEASRERRQSEQRGSEAQEGSVRRAGQNEAGVGPRGGRRRRVMARRPRCLRMCMCVCATRNRWDYYYH